MPNNRRNLEKLTSRWKTTKIFSTADNKLKVQKLLIFGFRQKLVSYTLKNISQYSLLWLWMTDKLPNVSKKEKWSSRNMILLTRLPLDVLIQPLKKKNQTELTDKEKIFLNFECILFKPPFFTFFKFDEPYLDEFLGYGLDSLDNSLIRMFEIWSLSPQRRFALIPSHSSTYIYIIYSLYCLMQKFIHFPGEIFLK